MVKKLTPEPVQVRIKGISPAKLLDARFVGMLEKEFPKIRYGPFHLFLPQDSEGKKFEGILLGFLDPEHESKLWFTIDCEEPETLNKLVHLFEQFLDGGA